MDKKLLDEILLNSRNFELFMKKIRKDYALYDIFNVETRNLSKYLKELGFENELVRTVIKHLSHHDFEKLFIIYNSYMFHKDGEKEGLFPHAVFTIGEMATMPIIFMDDVLDSHIERNKKRTPFGYFTDSFPRYKKEGALFLANIMSNYFLMRVLSFDDIDDKMRISLLRECTSCLNKTIFGGLAEQKIIPKSMRDVLKIYKIKSYYFTTYLLSSWGASLANNTIIGGKNFKNMILNITYLTQMNNDLSDFFGFSGKEKRFEDVFNYSNSLLLYFLYMRSGNEKEVFDIINKKRGDEISSLEKHPLKKEVLKVSLALRKDCLEYIGGFIKDGKNQVSCVNYKNYVDRLTNDIISKLKNI